MLEGLPKGTGFFFFFLLHDVQEDLTVTFKVPTIITHLKLMGLIYSPKNIIP